MCLNISHKLVTSVVRQVMRTFSCGSSNSLVKRRRHQKGSRIIFKIYVLLLPGRTIEKHWEVHQQCTFCWRYL